MRTDSIEFKQLLNNLIADVLNPDRKARQHILVREFITEINKPQRRRKSHINWLGQYLITRPNGSTVIVDNLNQWCKTAGLNRSAFVEVLNGNRRGHKGYKAEYYTESK